MFEGCIHWTSESLGPTGVKMVTNTFKVVSFCVFLFSSSSGSVSPSLGRALESRQSWERIEGPRPVSRTLHNRVEVRSIGKSRNSHM